ncbi:MAG: helix-turn-helix transcriptional regulator [Clostridia bacterium]|nr:helix-turn-helix transcriptional regulator [Clostridia bacterium]
MKKIIISEKIKNYRYQNHLTQADFGKMIGVSAQAISKWERGDCYPDITLLPFLAKILSCSINDFFE